MTPVGHSSGEIVKNQSCQNVGTARRFGKRSQAFTKNDVRTTYPEVRNITRRRFLAFNLIVSVLICMCTTANARPEGTRDFQHFVGLGHETKVHVNLALGEALRFCSSDDGVNDIYPVHSHCLGGPIACDEEPGEWVHIDSQTEQDGLLQPGRRQAAILVWPPAPEVCAGDMECNFENGLSCRTQDGQPVGGEGQALEGHCAYRFDVQSNPASPDEARAPAPGFCTALHPEDSRDYHSITANVAGIWTIDFAGEAPTLLSHHPRRLTSEKASTRFFEIDILGPEGEERPNGRIFRNDGA